jgi:hypothetical protein
MSVKSSLELIFVCLLFLTMPTLDKTYLFIQNFSVFLAADSVLVTNLVLQIKGGMMAIFIFRYTFK